VDSTTSVQYMSKFGEEERNRNPHNLRLRVVAFLIDPVAHRPKDGFRMDSI
jgi:hypothetical protein